MDPLTPTSNQPAPAGTSGYDDPAVDEQARNLTKAIFQHESGTDYNASGDAGTSHGAGQWQDATWKAQAKDVLGDENAAMTPANQSVVAQGTIRKLIKSGKNAAQIAAIWNSGSDEGWENKVGKTTINGQTISYNVPKYVKDVTDLYQQYKGQPQGQTSVNAPNQPAQSTPGGAGFLSSVGNDLSHRLNDIGSAVSNTATGKINPASGLLQTIGGIAGGVGDVTGEAAKGLYNSLVPNAVRNPINQAVGGAVQAVGNSPVGQAVGQQVSQFQQAHPELSADIGAVGNIASAIPAVKGLGLAKDAIGGAAEGLLRGSSDAVYDAVSPKLSAKGTADAIANRGTSKQGILGKIVLNPDKNAQGIAEAVRANVPDFNPADLTGSINKTQAVADRMADELKQDVINSGQDRIYSPNELRGILNGIEAPISVRGTPFEKQIGPLKQAVLDLAKTNGYKVSDLLEVRKQFDQLINKTYPTLWDSENAPIRGAVKSLRDTLTNYTADRLPSEVGLKERLLVQHKLLSAIENMSEKAAAGPTKEIGTTAVGRFGKRHPGLRKVGKGIIRGAILGTGIKGAENLIP